MELETGRMDPAVKAAVIKALRDPASKQGRLKLRNDIEPGDGKGGVCCLELVCQEAIKTGIIPPPAFRVHRTAEKGWVYGVPGDASDTYLPAAVRQWAGLDDSDPTFAFEDLRNRDGYEYHITWSSLNDELQLTFPQIADMVDYFF
jgi:hypothetical protein